MGARYFIDGQAVCSLQASRSCMNFDGSTTIEGRDRSGTLEFRENSITTTTTSGAGTIVSGTTKFDDDGNGTYERSQTIATTTAADGSSTRIIRNFDASGALVNATQTVTAANTATSSARSVTTSLDQNGDGLFDEVQAYSRDATGASQTLTTKLAANGTVLARQLVTATADGNTRTVQTDADGKVDKPANDNANEVQYAA